MSGWPYEFLTIDKEQRSARRELLNSYGVMPQLIVMGVLLPVLVYRIAQSASAAAKTKYGGAYDVIPDSPVMKARRGSVVGSWKTRARQVRWWLGDDVEFPHFVGEHLRGKRNEWIFGTLWALVLIALCFPETGRDYLHMTKRFGVIATSQWPIQYLLALKCLNPFAWLFRSSHEEVNRWHRVLGRIIYLLLIIHAALYLNFFLLSGILQKKIFEFVVLVGVIAFLALNLLMGTSLPIIRHYSYRLFFIVHLLTVFILPPLIWLHAKHSPVARAFVIEALVIFILDLATRKLRYTATLPASVSAIPGTDLIKVNAAIPPAWINRYRTQPGAHVYLSIPPASRPDPNPTSPSHLLFEFLFNPFSVAGVDEEKDTITLVARRCKGTLTNALAGFAARTASATTSGTDEVSTTNGGEIKVPLSIEGPYGSARHFFPNLSGSTHFDRILLVAGGVGATFLVPIYRAILADNPVAKLDFIWAVRSAGDATWAVSDERSIIDDKAVQIFLTGDIVASAAGQGETEAVEMRDRRPGRVQTRNRRRPDLRKAVDDVFRQGTEERVAVLVCGPKAMGRELRVCVGGWVMKGRDVWWHDETFGW